MDLSKEFQLVLELLKEFGIFSFVEDTQSRLYTNTNTNTNLFQSVDNDTLNSIKSNLDNTLLTINHQKSKVVQTNNTVSKDTTSSNGENYINTTDKTLEYTSLVNVISLEELKKIVVNYKACTLSKMATNTVFGVGSPDADLLMIGEAPGAEEDLKGEPFVGKSGQLLYKALTTIKVFRENIFTTNTIFWRPPGNRNPTSFEVNLCMPFIQKIISLIKPKMILIVGKVAANSLLGEDTAISKLRGRWFVKNWGYKDEVVKNISVRVLYHPAYLLRNPKQKKVFWFDLIEISNKIIDLQLSV